MSPRVTVLMPVYNGEKYLIEAIRSILTQSFMDYEFLIINDGSTDDSVKIIKSFSDKRIRLVHNEKNIGQANSLNNGINLARGEYIVRMDADDISLPERIKKQVKFMDANPEIGISGTWIKPLYEKLVWGKKINGCFPVDPAEVRCFLLFQVPMIHPTVIMRKKTILSNNLYYNPSCETAEDYDLWVRASKKVPITNIGEVLLHYRIHPAQVSVKDKKIQYQVCRYVRQEAMRELGLFPNSEESRIHNLISEGQYFDKKEDVIKAFNWIKKIENSNKQKKVFDCNALSKYLAYRWFRVCKNSSRLGLWVFKTYLKSESNRSNQVGSKLKAKLFLKCIIKI